MSAPRRDLEDLLLCDGFVRSLARELATDRDHAEDVAQEVWVAALERRPLPGMSLTAWIHAVVRNVSGTLRRGDARRVEREHDVARPEAIRSADEILEREATRRRVVEAVVALEEPYRSTLLLRYFDNLPPRAIAKRFGVPVETVRTRTKRGLEQLRARLDREYGGNRGAWCVALAPMAQLPSAVPVAATTKLAAWKGLLVAMSTQAKVGATALALVVLSLAFFVAFDREVSRAALPSDQTASVLASAAKETPSIPLAAPVAPQEAPARSAVAAIGSTQPDAPPEFGSLILHLIWERDKQPAIGICARVYFWNEQSAFVGARTCTSGQDGSIRLERVRPQRVEIELDRDNVKGATVIAGETCEITREISEGFDVQGEVVDETGAPVAGAEIWLCRLESPAEGFAVARSSERGEFAVRSISGAHSIGARAPGRAPSILQNPIAGTGEKLHVRLVLRGAGGAVTGRVVDPDEHQVAGAMVILGNVRAGARSIRLEDGTWGNDFDVAVVRTDARGAFRCEGLAPGETPVFVRAEGFASFAGSVLVLEHGVTELEARLCAGVRIAGNVTDSSGRAAERVEVHVSDKWLLDTRAYSAEDGSFVLEHLTPGDIVVYADGGDRGKVQASFHASSGSELTWNPRLQRGLQIAGRVIDESGGPLAGWAVSMSDEPGAADADFDSLVATTDQDGRFVFTNCHDRGHQLDARAAIARFPSAVLRNVRPGREEVVVRVIDVMRGSVKIVGTLVDSEGMPTAAAILNPWRADWFSSPNETPAEGTGRIELGPYPPGEWSLIVRSLNYPELRRGPKQLEAGETWDVGTIRLEVGGALCVRLLRERGVPEAKPFLALLYQGRWSDADFRFDGDSACADHLASGDYLLLISGEGVASTSMPFEIVSNVEKRLDVTLRAGVPCALRIESAEPDVALRNVSGQIRDADGAFVHYLGLYRKDGPPFEMSVFLAPGEYRVEVAAEDGRKAAGDLHVGELGSAGEKIVLTLQ